MPTVSSGRTKQIASTVTLETVERIDYWADDEKRTFSQMVQILLTEALDKRDGIANKKSKPVKK
jgi:hypothetical protein